MTLLWQELEKRNIPIQRCCLSLPGATGSRYGRVRASGGMWRDWCEGKCERFISLFPEFFAVKDACPRSQPGCWYLRYFIFGDFHYKRRRQRPGGGQGHQRS